MHLPACVSIAPASFCRRPKHRPFVLPFRAPLFFNRMLCRVGIFGTLPILSAEVGHGCSALAKCSYVSRPNKNASARWNSSPMTIPASLSKWAHPRRANTPSSPSTGFTPGPCITPSTETCVIVVSFMVCPFSRIPKFRGHYSLSPPFHSLGSGLTYSITACSLVHSDWLASPSPSTTPRVCLRT
jgi:hypothetical protein